MVQPLNEPAPQNQQNEPEIPQSESTIPIDSDNTPTQTFETKRQIESHETDVIQPKFHPPKTYVFPKTKIGSRERSFHAHWCEDYPWLHYNAEKDAAFCYVCMISDKKKKHNRFSSYKELTFIETGFRNWKKCPKAFIDHATSEYHRDNVLLLAEEEKTGDVSELISTEHKRQKTNNRQVLLQVLQNIQFLSCQGLVFRNDNDSGNFDQLLKKVNKLILE